MDISSWTCRLFGHKLDIETRVDCHYGPRVIAQAKENLKKIDYGGVVKYSIQRCTRCKFWCWLESKTNGK